MPQTRQNKRRSVSVRPEVYMRLVLLMESTGRSGSAMLEDLINAEADKRGLQTFTNAEAVKRLARERSSKIVEPEHPGSHFTF